MDSSISQYWQKTIDLVKRSGYFDNGTITWIEKTSLFKILNNLAYVSCRSAIAANIIDEHQQLFEDTLSEVYGEPLKITVTSSREVEEVTVVLHQKTKQALGRNFDPRYTFDSFVKGPSNQEALAASMAVCNPTAFLHLNPLLIYGSSGLGKTHILNAIGNTLIRNQPKGRVLYFYAGDLVSLLLDAMRTKNGTTNGVEMIKECLLDCDYFLVDDIQNLRSASCQEVFFSVFNELIYQNKQIILTSDTHPSEIPALTKRLISRFSSGLIVNVSKPEAQTAKLILKKKVAGYESIFEIEEDVLDFLSVSYSEDIRALEGALNRLIFNATLFNPHSITMEFALEVLKDEPTILKPEQKLDGKSIKKAVARYYGLAYQDLEGKSRQKKITQARQVCIYLMREMLGLSFGQIGEQLGGRDHTTISSSCTRAKKMIQSDETWKEAVETLKKKILVS